MKAWCVLSPEEAVHLGNFVEDRLLSHSGEPLEAIEDLMRQLAARVMARFESQPSTSMFVLDEGLLERPTRTKAFYRRLLTNAGEPTEDFLVWSSETLALWMEESMDATFASVAGGPYETDPAFDVLSVVPDNDIGWRLRAVQVKKTPDNLAVNCNAAIRKFERLERGDYDAELMNRLSRLRDGGRLSDGMLPEDLVFDLPNRRYRIVAVHGEDRDQLQICTTYDRKIVGDASRRGVRLVRIENWEAFWKELARLVYEKLT